MSTIMNHQHSYLGCLIFELNKPLLHYLSFFQPIKTLTLKVDYKTLTFYVLLMIFVTYDKTLAL